MKTVHVKSKCKQCKQSFVRFRRGQKYCSNPCRDVARKEQAAEWERNAKRPPHLYRKKKDGFAEFQLELPLDFVRRGPYKRAS